MSISFLNFFKGNCRIKKKGVNRDDQTIGLGRLTQLVNAGFMTGPFLLTQAKLLNFACGGFGQWSEFNCLGTFEMRQMVTAKVDDFFCCSRSTRLRMSADRGSQHGCRRR